MTTHQRSADYELIATTAANREAIANMKEDISEIKDDLRNLETKVDEGFSTILSRLDANQNQLIGASKLAKVLKEALPIACGFLGGGALGKYLL